MDLRNHSEVKIGKRFLLIVVMSTLMVSCDRPSDQLVKVIGPIARNVKIIQFTNYGGKDYMMAWKLEVPPGKFDTVVQTMYDARDDSNYLRTLAGQVLGEGIPQCLVMKKCEGVDCVAIMMVSRTRIYVLAYKAR